MMKVALYGNDEDELARLAALLGQEGYVIVGPTTNLRAAHAAFASAPLGILNVNDLSAPMLGAVSRLKGGGGSQPAPYLLLLANDASNVALRTAYQAGVDGHLLGPYDDVDLLGRVRAAERWLHPRTASPQPARLESRSSSQDALARMQSGRTWIDIAAHLSAAIGALFSTSMTVEPVSPNPFVELGAAITLTDARHKLEVRIAIGAERTKALKLAHRLVGEDPAAGFEEEVLAELANVMMGTLKARFVEEGISLAAGLPSAIAAASVMTTPTGFVGVVPFVVRGPDGPLFVHASMRSLDMVELTPSLLREGMVVVNDVYNPRGVLLLRAGTALSENMIARLWDTFSSKHTITVAMAVG